MASLSFVYRYLLLFGTLMYLGIYSAILCKPNAESFFINFIQTQILQLRDKEIVLS